MTADRHALTAALEYSAKLEADINESARLIDRLRNENATYRRQLGNVRRVSREVDKTNCDEAESTEAMTAECSMPPLRKYLD